MLTAIAAFVLTQGPGTAAPVLNQVTARVQYLVANEKVNWKGVAPAKMTVIEKPLIDLPDRVLLFTGNGKSFAALPYGTGNFAPGSTEEAKPFFSPISSPVVRTLAGKPAMVRQSLPGDRGSALQLTVTQNKENAFLYDVAVGYDPMMRDAEIDRAYAFTYKATMSQAQTIVLAFPVTASGSLKDQLQAIAIWIDPSL